MHLLASLGFVLQGEENAWKISNIIRASFDFRAGDILIKYGDEWLAGLKEEEAKAMLNVSPGTRISLGIEKKAGEIREYELSSSAWSQGKVDLNVEYSGKKLKLGPGNIEAERQWLKLDDEIISIAGKNIKGMAFEEIKWLMEKGVAGEKCEIIARRDIVMTRKSVTSAGETFGGIGVQISSSPRGIFINQVVDNMPAKVAGIKPEDVIAAIEGETIIDKPFNQAIELLRGKVGTAIILTIERIARIPYKSFGTQYKGLGIEAHREGQVMAITDIIPGSPAEAAGIKIGEKISSFMGQKFLREPVDSSRLDKIFQPSSKEEEIIIERKIHISGDELGIRLEKNGLFCMVSSIAKSTNTEIAGIKEGDILVNAGEASLAGKSPAYVTKLLSDKVAEGIHLVIRRKIKVKISNKWFL